MLLAKRGRNFAAGMERRHSICVLMKRESLKIAVIFQWSILNRYPKKTRWQNWFIASGELEGHGRVDVLRGNMSGHDKERLIHLLENHVRYTNKWNAQKNILNNINSYLPKFVKVMPVEYKTGSRRNGSSDNIPISV